MKFSKLVNDLKLYLDVPDINLKTFKEVLALILDCCSVKEKEKFSKMILQRFDFTSFNKVQLSLVKNLELIKRRKELK